MSASLKEARLQLHYAVQPVAAAGHTLLPPRPDYTQESLGWSPELGGFVGEPLPSHGGMLRAALRVAPLALCVVDARFAVRGELPLAGRTAAEALDWLAKALGAPLTLPKHPDFPEHPIAGGAPFTPDPGAPELARLYGLAAALLVERAGGAAVRIWPHHFDIAFLGAGPRDGETVGAGLSPGDAAIAEPYWYVTAWPYPSTTDLPRLPGDGFWNTERWVGAVLPARGQEEGQVAAFLDAALAACHQLLADRPATKEEPADWRDAGAIEELAEKPLHDLKLGRTRLAIVHRDGVFSAISGVCNHVGGPLGQGRLDGDYVVCPWHNWKFHAATGLGEPGYEEDAVPAYQTKVERGRLFVDLKPISKRSRKPHARHPLTQIRRRGEEGGPAADSPLRVLGISTTVMDAQNPRSSTSETLLEVALEHATTRLGAQTRLLRLNDLRFRSCEGYYSKSAQACTWPCSITEMDAADQMERVYEGIVAWADVVLVATPIRWGNASSLYYKMAERMNCIQNQVTIANRVLIRNKVAGFIVTGGQDNVQGVVGQMLTFFSELGFVFPQFPFIGHSRGWSAEDMERNVEYVAQSTELREGAQALVERALEMARTLFHQAVEHGAIPRGGRKAHQLDVRAQI